MSLFSIESKFDHGTFADQPAAHAGQVLHAARAIRLYHNRGQDSFIIYHSIMVLWTYSMIINDYARKTGSNTPVRTAHAIMQN